MVAASSSDTKKPILYLIYGDDSLAMTKIEKEMTARLGEESIAEMNISRFQGSPRIEELRNAAFAMPFLAERRLVIVTKALDLVRGSKNKDAFLELISQMPQSSALVLMVETEIERKKWKDFDAGHWLLKWAKTQSANQVWLRECSQPDAYNMRNWILEEVNRRNGQFVPAAAQELASHIGSNTQLASLEIDKLLNYVNFERPVEVDDVIELVSDVAALNVFDLVDTIAEGKKKEALQLLHGLLETEDIYMLFGMVVRQFRLLIMAREILDQGGNKEQISKQMGVHTFVAGKLEKQAHYFPQLELKHIYKKLLAIDENMKTSQMDAQIALDLFVSELVVA